MRLTAGLRPHPLGSLSAPLGPLLLADWGRREEGKGRGAEGREGTASSLFNFWLRAWRVGALNSNTVHFKTLLS